MQDHDKTDESLEMRERAGTLETRVSTLRAMLLLLLKKNEVLKNVLASLRLTQTAQGQKVDSEQAVEEHGGTASRPSKRWLMIVAAALVVVGAAEICVWMLRPEPGRDDQLVERALIAARKRVSELEADLETQAGTPAEQTRLLKEMLGAKDEEIQRLRLEALRMRKEINGLRSDLSSLTKENDEEIVRLEGVIAWMKEKSWEEISGIKLEKNKEIKTLQNKIEWLNTIKGVAIPGLIDALDHQDVNSRNIIAKTLTELTGKSFGTNQEKWRKWWRKSRLNFIRR